MPSHLDESRLELATVDCFRELGYEHIHGPIATPDGEAPERQDYGQVVLIRRLRDAMVRINPDVPDDAIEDALRQVTRTDSLSPSAKTAASPACATRCCPSSRVRLNFLSPKNSSKVLNCDR